MYEVIAVNQCHSTKPYYHADPQPLGPYEPDINYIYYDYHMIDVQLLTIWPTVRTI